MVHRGGGAVGCNVPSEREGSAPEVNAGEIIVEPQVYIFIGYSLICYPLAYLVTRSGCKL